MYSVIQFPFVDARLLPMAIFILGLYGYLYFRATLNFLVLKNYI